MSKTFKEKISSYLTDQLKALAAQYGQDSPEYKGLALQYLYDPREDDLSVENNMKHYEAGVEVITGEEVLHGVERLYKKTLVIEPTLVCAAHCRYCLRSNYATTTLTEPQLIELAKYCGSDSRKEQVNEVLITGGDPLLIPRRLNFLIEALIEYAPNIKIVRIGSRVMSHAPSKIDESVLAIFNNKPGLRFEVATQINHPVEFTSETSMAFKRLRESGVKLYAQNVLLKGVNNNKDTLAQLYNLMRLHDIEAHYLFHCVPMRGIHHLRTSVQQGVALIKELVVSGAVSGRVKPMYAAMTDIGKITFYENTIAKAENGRLLLTSMYKLEDRLAYNPNWILPSNAFCDENGYLSVWYLDGED